MTDLAQTYNQTFYAQQRDLSLASARVIVPMVMDLLPVRSVVDVGCGLATWLSVFRQAGVQDILGLDGDYVDVKALMVPQENFRATDLSQAFSLDRRFDLAVSLEVAEHLPFANSDAFVASLVRLAPCVLFSAALPHQGGTHHINEQWPEFWAERFANHGYTVIDCVRKSVWNHPDVQWCYAQNTLLFVDEKRLAEFPKLQALAGSHNLSQLSIVHPEVFLSHADPDRQSFRASVRSACEVGWKNGVSRLQRILGKGR